MKIAIYHMTTGALRHGFDDAGRVGADEAAGIILRGVSENRYVYCARVKFDDPVANGVVDFDEAMELAYKFTQNDMSETGRWAEGEGIIYSAGVRQRSSMVGDVFVYGPDAWVVSGAGFKKLPQAVASAIVEGSKQGTAFDDSL